MGEIRSFYVSISNVLAMSNHNRNRFPESPGLLMHVTKAVQISNHPILRDKPHNVAARSTCVSEEYLKHAPEYTLVSI